MKWLRGRGRRKWLVLTFAAVTLAAIVPFHFAGGSTRSRTMMLALEQRYSRGKEIDPVYIEAGPNLLEGPGVISQQPVEIISRHDLTERYTGKKIAPALTTVNVSEEHDLLGLRYTVIVSSSAFEVPGVTAWPWGGTHIYYFRQWGGLLWADGERFIAH